MRQSIGIETRGGKFTKLIERGSALPATCSEIFTTADAGQTSIQITVFRGDHRQAARNENLGVFELSGIAPGPAGQHQIETTFTVDPAGNLTVSARYLGTGAELPVYRT
jgi:molecular chaperone DnaK